MISGFRPDIGKTSLTTYFICTCEVATVERVLLVLLGSFYVEIFNK